MFPVWGKPAIGIAAILNDVMVGAAEAVAERPSAARLSTARQVDVLCDAALLIMDLPFCSTEYRDVHMGDGCHRKGFSEDAHQQMLLHPAV